MKTQLRFLLTMLFTISDFLKRYAIRNINVGCFSSFVSDIAAAYQHSFVFIYPYQHALNRLRAGKHLLS